MPSFAARQFPVAGNGPDPIDLNADNGPSLNAVLWVLVTCSGVFLGLRIYCKFLKHRGLWWDDHLLIASWVCLTIDAGLVTSTIALGYGKHMAVVPSANFLPIFLHQNIGTAFVITGAVWSKTSFGLTLLRVTEGKLKAAMWFMIVSMNVAMGLSALLPWVQCSPIEKSWDNTIPGTCWNSKASFVLAIFASVYSGVMDVIFALLPWKIVWNLQMKRKEKIGVAFAMSMGVFAGTTAFVKCAKIADVSLNDFTFYSTQVSAWGEAEIATTIMAASIPVLRVLVGEIKASAGRRDGYTNYGSASGTRSGTRRGGGGTGVHGDTSTVTVSVLARGGEGGNPTRTKRSSGGVKILKRTSAAAVGGDDRSDKSILDVHIIEGRILHTTEVAVEYQDGKKTAGQDEYEMGRIV